MRNIAGLPKRFWVALGLTVAPFLATPLVVNALTGEQELRELAVGLVSALVVAGLAIVTVLVIIVYRNRFDRQVRLGVAVGLAVGIVAGGVGCFAVMGELQGWV